MKRGKLITALIIFMILLGNIAIVISVIGFGEARDRVLLIDKNLREVHPEVMQQSIIENYSFSIFMKDTFINMSLYRDAMLFLGLLMLLAILSTAFIRIKSKTHNV